MKLSAIPSATKKSADCYLLRALQPRVPALFVEQLPGLSIASRFFRPELYLLVPESYFGSAAGRVAAQPP